MVSKPEPRRGAGRVAADGATNVQRATITLTEQDRDKLRQLGGSLWVRTQIRRAPVSTKAARKDHSL